jgi:adenylate cyclase
MSRFRRFAIFSVFLTMVIVSNCLLTGKTVNNSDIISRLSKVVIKNDSLFLPSEVKKDNEYIFGGKLVLSQRENDIAFEFASVEKVSYRFLLEGFDTDWTRLQNIGLKEYTNLPSGRYVLHAKWVSEAGVTGEMKDVSFRVLPHWYSSWPAIAIYNILFILIAWVFYNQLNFRFARTQYMLEQIINTRTEDLIVEKEKTETLLSNVLPKNTANEIMEKGKATKIKYNFVTVLFSDIQGFTKIAEEMNPEVLIDELDKFFFHFDSVVEKYGIEKIKTIGDAYMCAGGIPEKNRTNPVEVIVAALEMQQYMNRLKASSELAGMKYWDIRIGIHTGTVVAGVVGQKKLSYDIWGDTVNTASRMESSGEAGKINISGTTYEFVKEFFICEYRGKMPVKYKGEIDMYFVNGIVDELRDENQGPNRKFIVKMQMLKLQDIEEYIIKMYDDEAPPNLYFHNSGLVKSVSNQVDLLSNAERLPDEDFIHLRLAAILLFSGYISDYDRPQEVSCSLVEEVLPKYGFSQENIDKTKRIIANSYGGKRESLCDDILFDARYDYMGRVDYIKLTDKLLREETEYGKVTDSKTWIREQRKLLADHEFITPTAKLLRSVGSEQQISDLQEYAKEIK